MGYLGAAAIGGIGGLGEGGAEAGRLNFKAQQEDAHARLLDQQTSIREERNIALRAKAAQDLEAQKGTVVAPGSTLRRYGQPDFTAPIKTPQEQLDYYSASANRLNAEAQAIRDGMKYRDKQAKPTLPKVIVKTDEAGNTFLFDENSGSVGTLVPGVPAQEGKSHWFSADEPARPAEAHRTLWRLPNGSVAPDLRSMYPDIAKRSGAPGIRDPFQADPLDLRPSLPQKPPLSTFFGTPTGKNANVTAVPLDQASNMPVALGANTSSAADSAGMKLDDARARVADARSRFQSYGSLQRRRDPAGFQAAQQDYEKAQHDVQEALDQWHRNVGFEKAAPLQGLLRAK